MINTSHKLQNGVHVYQKSKCSQNHYALGIIVRSREFWPTCRENWENKDYFMNLRVDKETFLLITEKLAPYIHQELIRPRQSIPDNERVAMALWRYETRDSSQKIS